MGSLLDIMNLYSSDISSQCTLLIDYLKGLTYLQNQKGVMHRDVSPKNLGVVSFDPPRGILLDLDSATHDEGSTDHMQGTVPYLAPEIVQIKEQKEQKDPAAQQSPGPIPYRKGVDVWALGLSVFALYNGHEFSWGPYNPRNSLRTTKVSVNRVNAESYHMLKRRLEAKRVSLDGDHAGSLLELIESMIKWKPIDRITATEALESA